MEHTSQYTWEMAFIMFINKHSGMYFVKLAVRNYTLVMPWGVEEIGLSHCHILKAAYSQSGDYTFFKHL